MIRHDLRRTSFDQIALGITFTAIAFLYCLSSGTILRAPLSGTVVDAAADDRHAAHPMTTPAPRASAPRSADPFAAIGYHLDAVREHGEVPRIFMASLPADLVEDAVPAQRKAVFIKTALPLILHVNELIGVDRARIETLRDRSLRGELLSDEEVAWLDRTAETYGIARTDRGDFAELLRRVDVIPPSLALAQAAEESGWGTSRFAREGNALFGQRIWRDGDGMVPQDRGEGETYRVAAFAELIDGVRSYAHNLNTHASYEKFRATRLSQRIDGSGLDGYALAGMLTRYSERGPAYVRTIRTIIRSNALDSFDRARLGPQLITAASLLPDA